MRLDNFVDLKKEVDYIIVGQGIAGTLLAYQLLIKGKSILVVDRGYEKSSSYVAAGLMNPTVLKRITKTWRAEEFTAYNRSFYESLNTFLKGIYYQELPFSKLITSSDEKDFWSHRYEQEDLKKYIEKELSQADNLKQFTSPFLEGKVKKTAWLNIKPLLKDFRSLLIYKNNLLAEDFDFSKLTFLKATVSYKQFEAKKIIFCEGAKISENPYFNYLPMVLNKGELITIRSTSFKSEKILNKKVFILPIKENIYKIGATFEWKWETEEPTNNRKLELETNLKNITNKTYQIINHEAGIRPSSRDRRPIIGLHYDNNKLAVFNGLGSRGCLMAPLLCNEFIAFLDGSGTISNEIDIKRFDRFKPSLTS